MTMMPVNAGVYSHLQDAPTHQINNTTDAVLLHIAGQNAQEFITWLIGQSIPFELCFSPTSFEKSSPKFCGTESFEEQMPELIPAHRIRTTVRKAIERVYQKYIENVNIDAPAMSVLAQEAGVCAHTFNINFRLLYQKSFIQAHLEKRMEYAACLLGKGYSCYAVSRMVGYGEKSAIKFNRMFQRHYGMTPKKYQMERKYTSH